MKSLSYCSITQGAPHKTYLPDFLGQSPLELYFQAHLYGTSADTNRTPPVALVGGGHLAVQGGVRKQC
jgi:hypothetical protein